MRKSNLHPESCKRRSPIYRKLLELDISLTEVNDGITDLSFKEPYSEKENAGKLALSDFSLLPRIGFKGTGTCEWLIEQGMTIPDEINHAEVHPDGNLIGRIGIEEVLIIKNINGHTGIISSLEKLWKALNRENFDHTVYMIPWQDSHACFCLTGKEVPTLLTKLCSVDLRSHKFSNHSVAHTYIAQTITTIIRHDLNDLFSCLILVDSTMAEYLWDCLVDAMHEFNGQIVGVTDQNNLK